MYYEFAKSCEDGSLLHLDTWISEILESHILECEHKFAVRGRAIALILLNTLSVIRKPMETEKYALDIVFIIFTSVFNKSDQDCTLPMISVIMTYLAAIARNSVVRNCIEKKIPWTAILFCLNQQISHLTRDSNKIDGSSKQEHRSILCPSARDYVLPEHHDMAGLLPFTKYLSDRWLDRPGGYEFWATEPEMVSQIRRQYIIDVGFYLTDCTTRIEYDYRRAEFTFPKEKRLMFGCRFLTQMSPEGKDHTVAMYM